MKEKIRLKDAKYKERGITLIALVVTIVVLLILAGISINFVLGPNGLISRAQQAAKGANEAVENDITSLDNLEQQIGEIVDEKNMDDLFRYEVTDETLKEAKITGLNPKYCNSNGYDPKTQKNDWDNTYYQIIYNDEVITDTLIIPEKVKIGNEMYTITEVCLVVQPSGMDGWYGTQGIFPLVENIIYPDTVKSIYRGAVDHYWEWSINTKNEVTKSIVLPENLEIIKQGAFAFNAAIQEIHIPNTITKIEDYAFFRCNSLSDIYIDKPEGTVEISDKLGTSATIHWLGE